MVSGDSHPIFGYAKIISFITGRKKKNTRLVRFRNNRRVNPADDGGPSFKINYSSRNYAAATPTTVFRFLTVRLLTVFFPSPFVSVFILFRIFSRICPM